MSFDIAIYQIDGKLSPVELRQIECFLACCEHRSFTAAAQSLNMVQSAVSTSVARLERELDVRLFDRTPRALEPTEAGRAAVEPARTMLRARREIAEAVEFAPGRIVGEVVIGNLMNIRSIDLAALIAALHRRYPEVTMQMRQSTSGIAGNIAALRAGALDIALLAGIQEELNGITLYPIISETIVLATAPDHPLANRPFRAADLAGIRFVDYPPGWGIRGIVDRRYPARRPVIEVADQNFALELAAADFGVTMVPRSMAEATPGIAFSTPADGALPWQLTVGHLTRRTPTAAARLIIDALCAAGRP